jgi:hypothetical protein
MIRIIVKALAFLAALAEREVAKQEKAQKDYKDGRKLQAIDLRVVRAELEKKLAKVNDEIATCNAQAAMGCVEIERRLSGARTLRAKVKAAN